MTIQLNPTTSDAYESKTLSALRQMVFDSMGFLNLLAATRTETLGAIRGDIYNMLGMGAMTTPLPGVVNMLNSFINEAQQTLFRAVEFGTGSLVAPAILVNDTDVSAIDGTAIRQLALGMAKAHFGQQDGQIYLQQNAKYLKDLVSRLPPNATSLINRLLKNAQFMLYRRYPVFRMERWFTWTFVAAQRFYSITGNDERAPLATPTGTAVTSGAAGTYGSLNTARWDSSATILPNGQILIAGGYDGTGSTATAELYDPSTGLFSYTGNMTTPRTAPLVAPLSTGLVLVAGGGYGTPIASSELYNPANGTFTATGSMITARDSTGQAVLLQNGKVLACGGLNNTTVNASSELFDPATGTWTATGDLATGIRQGAMVRLGNGKVLLCGGFNNAGTQSNVAQLYDPSTGTWSATGNMVTARSNHFAVLLTNGKVLVGGCNSLFVTANAEIYDPSTGVWTATGALNFGRDRATATLLPSGKVLVAGGSIPVTGAVNTAELFDVNAGTFSNVVSTMSVAHWKHFAVYSPYTLKVYIGGGEISTTSAQAKAEIFDYSNSTFSPSGIHTSGSRSYRVAFTDANGKTTLAATEVSATIAGDTAAVITWDLPTNPSVKYAVIYGRSAGTELRLGQVDASLGTYTDYGTIVPSGALPTANTTGNIGPILDQREISWVGISQGDVGWRPLAKSVPPTNYSNLATAIPNFYDIREQIEVWPAPVSNAWQLRIKGYFTPGPFELDTDTTTIDWQAVYLQAVADAKVAFKQPDAGLAQAQLRTYIGDLVAGTHGTRRYIPGPPGQLPMTRPIALDANGNPLP